MMLISYGFTLSNDQPGRPSNVYPQWHASHRTLGDLPHWGEAEDLAYRLRRVVETWCDEQLRREASVADTAREVPF